jgi:hypothetical protein
MNIGRRISALFKGDALPHDGIAAHYRAFWGEDRIEEVHWTPAHLGSLLPDFHIAKVKPAEPGGSGRSLQSAPGVPPPASRAESSLSPSRAA